MNNLIQSLLDREEAKNPAFIPKLAINDWLVIIGKENWRLRYQFS